MHTHAQLAGGGALALSQRGGACRYASWVDVNVKTRVFGAGCCLCFITPEPINIKVTVPCSIM